MMVVDYCPERARENHALPLIVKLTYNATKVAISVELEIIAGQVFTLSRVLDPIQCATDHGQVTRGSYILGNPH